MLGDWAEVSLDVGHTSTFWLLDGKGHHQQSSPGFGQFGTCQSYFRPCFLPFSRPGPNGARGFEAVFGSHLFGFNSNGAVLHHGDWDHVRCTLSG